MRMITWPQLVREISSGRMKSFSCDVKESEDRLLIIALPNERQLFGWKMSLKSMLASPNVRASFCPVEIRPSESAAGITEVLIVPAAHGPPPQVADGASISAGAPQAVPLHVRAVRSARAPP